MEISDLVSISNSIPTVDFITQLKNDMTHLDSLNLPEFDSDYQDWELTLKRLSGMFRIQVSDCKDKSPGVQTKMRNLFKKIVAKLIGFYYAPALESQVNFNYEVIRLLNSLTPYVNKCTHCGQGDK